jgi:hypothetical protein
MQEISPPVDIHLHSKRHRLTDPDGASGKWVIDAIVKAGILPDDSATFVNKVTKSQEKISLSEPETVTITITEATCASPKK